MKKILLFLCVLLSAVYSDAQSVRIHLKNGTQVSYSSRQVDYIDFIEESSRPDQPDTETGHNSEPRFSETVEMMCLIWRLAGASEYSNCHVTSISESADHYFASVTNHQAVNLARQYHQQGISYDAVTGYGNMLIFDNNGKLIFDPNYLEGSNSSFDRWTQKQKYDMLEAVNSFYYASNFHDWFVSTEKMQEKAKHLFMATCDLDYTWFDTFFGKNDKIASRIILSFLIGPSNNGISFCRSDGTQFLTPVFGSFSEYSGVMRFDGDINLVVHEFSHPYCNPLIETYWDSMADMANKMFSLVRTPMQSQAYGNPLTMMCETLVRVSAIRYMLDYYGENEKENYIMNEEGRGFLLVRSMVEAFEKRKSNPSEYPTLDSFMPELISVINAFPVDDLSEKVSEKAETPDAEPETESSTADKNLLPGAFSVSPTKKVKFTKGNLYWNGSAYRLEADQLSYAKEWDPTHVSHFLWTNDTDVEKPDPAYQPYALNFPYEPPFSELSFADKCWCSKSRKITVDGTSGLYILSGDWNGEWNYILFERPNADHLYKYFVTIDGHDKCLVIAPDAYPGTIQSSYSASEWAAAEAEGLVCLIAAGARSGASFFDIDWGQYWSSTPLPFMPRFAQKLLFYQEGIGAVGDISKNCGLPIRLVKTITQ